MISLRYMHLNLEMHTCIRNYCRSFFVLCECHSYLYVCVYVGFNAKGGSNGHSNHVDHMVNVSSLCVYIHIILCHTHIIQVDCTKCTWKQHLEFINY